MDHDTTTIGSPAELNDVLVALGWTDERQDAFAEHAAEGLIPGRVVSMGGTMMATTSGGQVQVILQRRFLRAIIDHEGRPAIGDWLALQPQAGDATRSAVVAVLPRTGVFTRNRLSDGRAQVIAANIDIAFLVSGLDHDLNLRRIERYLVLTRDGGVEPVIVLNKADVVEDLPVALEAVREVAGGARIVAISAKTGSGVDDIADLVGPGTTACLLGSSGVGKSTITNALLGSERQVVRALREDDSRGRHTTSHRELFELDNGGLLIDTPGLRTVGVRGDARSVEASFRDLEDLAALCRFSDCTHQSEPGCAIIAAIEAGTVAASRVASQRKIEAERSAFEARASVRDRRQRERELTRGYKRAGRDAERFKRGS